MVVSQFWVFDCCLLARLTHRRSLDPVEVRGHGRRGWFVIQPLVPKWSVLSGLLFDPPLWAPWLCVWSPPPPLEYSLANFFFLSGCLNIFPECLAVAGGRGSCAAMLRANSWRWGQQNDREARRTKAAMAFSQCQKEQGHPLLSALHLKTKTKKRPE